MYHVFTRTWWKDSAGWPNNLEPEAGEKTTLDTVDTEEEAQELCEEYNSTHNPGRYSLKAEYELE